jgi:hypothetical protein
MEGNGWGLIWVTSGIFPEGLWKTMKNLSQDNLWADRGSIRATPRWKSEFWVNILGECVIDLTWVVRVWGAFIM